jgi:hypothetical protein
MEGRVAREELEKRKERREKREERKGGNLLYFSLFYLLPSLLFV